MSGRTFIGSGHTYIGSGHTYICVAIHMYNRLDIDTVKSVF